MPVAGIRSIYFAIRRFKERMEPPRHAQKKMHMSHDILERLPQYSVQHTGQIVIHNRGDIQADHPLWSDGVSLFNVVVHLDSKLPWFTAQNHLFTHRQVDRNRPLLAFPVVCDDRRRSYVPATCW